MGGTVEALVYNDREQPQRTKISDMVTQQDLNNLRSFKVAKVNLVGGGINSIVFAWQNPEANLIIVHEVIIRITTPGGTGGSLLDVDVVASATDTGDTIFDGLLLNGAAAVHGSHNIVDTVGANATEKPHLMDEKGGANAWLTGKCLIAVCTNLVGSAYIFYTEV